MKNSVKIEKKNCKNEKIISVKIKKINKIQ